MSVLEKRLQKMGDELVKWKPKSKVEKRDKKLIVLTLYYLKTGRVYKARPTKGEGR